ncbi:putative phosphoenolpyruvate phosphomutase [Polychaeton citri CBS 116435]|uniref:Phosphoenolpyruvate phosphomutase n=1 Tax=Polychaeton citri CBS 116435 TaxID=1314669 RepID=A0A9P4US38_9PEZI|nr:putative phosphoenolpyruvate phosphomutase [Polychaeton citri CBS 116435]
MSSSIKALLGSNNNRIRLLEAHDSISREIIRNGEGNDGEKFHGFWMSGLTQTTYLGVPDTELISPLERASAMAAKDYMGPTSDRRLGAAYDADSGGDPKDISALVLSLAKQGVSMVIIEDKFVGEPGNKVNSLKETSGSQSLAHPEEFAKIVRTFSKASANLDMMITARIEAFTVRKVIKGNEAAEKASVDAAMKDALRRAKIYRSAGAHAIMIHSKSSSPNEVLSFMKEFKASDPTATVVVVPTTYSQANEDILYDAGADVIIYANHLMRAKIRAVNDFSEEYLQGMTDIIAKDAEFKACVEAQNFGYLLQRLMSRESIDGVMKWYRILAEAYAVENMSRVVDCLLNGKTCSAADKHIISVKDLLKINSRQLDLLCSCKQVGCISV